MQHKNKADKVEDKTEFRFLDLVRFYFQKKL